MMRTLLILLILLTGSTLFAQKELHFGSLDSLLKYAEQHSSTIRTGDKQSLLAKSTKLAAIGNTINLRCPVSASFIDNTELPVNYVPGEFFGGPAGSTRELTLGQEYVTNYTVSPQIDIINPSSWSKVKSASLNARLTEVTNLINKKTLFENISATWYNIVALQEQREALMQSTKAADSMANISRKKFEQGIIREQDKNNMMINSLALQDKSAQIKIMIEQQYNNLRVLCDLPADLTLRINEESTASPVNVTIQPSDLSERQVQLQTSYLKSELRSNRTSLFAPTVSFVFGQGWQESSNKQFFDPDANKFSTQYYGLKISVPFPLEVMKLTQSYNAKINYQISQISREHAVLQSENTNRQLQLAYSAAWSSYETNKKISELKEINYTKSNHQFTEGILNTESLLTAFNDHINARLNEIAAKAALKQAESKIRINNSIQ